MISQIAEGISQLPEANWSNALFAYGPLGVVCAWLMFRTEKKLEALSSEIITELRVLGHRINGITRAMLSDVATREHTSDALKVIVNSELKKLEYDDEVKEMRSRKKG